MTNSPLVIKVDRDQNPGLLVIIQNSFSQRTSAYGSCIVKSHLFHILFHPLSISGYNKEMFSQNII